MTSIASRCSSLCISSSAIAACGEWTDFYRDDPLVLRCLGWRRMPDVSTVRRRLREMDAKAYHQIRDLSRELVWERLTFERFTTLTFDFDGSVELTKSLSTEGTAVGYNKAKGQRSYYPFFATVAQTGQVLDVLHRPGNVHDSNGAWELIEEVLATARQRCPQTRLRRNESRLDLECSLALRGFGVWSDGRARGGLRGQCCGRGVGGAASPVPHGIPESSGAHSDLHDRTGSEQLDA